jgi:hypothetical protein
MMNIRRAATLNTALNEPKFRRCCRIFSSIGFLSVIFAVAGCCLVKVPLTGIGTTLKVTAYSPMYAAERLGTAAKAHYMKHWHWPESLPALTRSSKGYLRVELESIGDNFEVITWEICSAQLRISVRKRPTQGNTSEASAAQVTIEAPSP